MSITFLQLRFAQAQTRVGRTYDEFGQVRGRVPCEAETRVRSQAETVGKKRGVRGGAKDWIWASKKKSS